MKELSRKEITSLLVDLCLATEPEEIKAITQKLGLSLTEDEFNRMLPNNRKMNQYDSPNKIRPSSSGGELK